MQIKVSENHGYYTGCQEKHVNIEHVFKGGLWWTLLESTGSVDMQGQSQIIWRMVIQILC